MISTMVTAFVFCLGSVLLTFIITIILVGYHNHLCFDDLGQYIEPEEAEEEGK